MTEVTKTLNKFISLCTSRGASRILDIGAGDQGHTKIMRQHNLTVETNDFETTTRAGTLFPDHPGDYLTLQDIGKFDGIWASHVLEHQRNPGLFLDKIHHELNEGGILSITVPPRKDNIVGGHVSLWNTGILLYHLILARFDCSTAAVSTYGYNCSVVVQKRTIKLPQLCSCKHDIQSLAKFFPREFRVVQGVNGVIQEINW